MTLQSVFLIAIALSLDAFGIALSIGLNPKANFIYKAKCVGSFGLFQFLFSLVGASSGFIFTTYVTSVPSLIGGVIIIIVGLLMIKEGLQQKDECSLIKPGIYILLGISVSIDAMVIGFTALSSITSKVIILNYTVIIGLVTVIMSTIAFLISKFLKKIEVVEKYASYIGGIILVIFGLKMMFF